MHLLEALRIGSAAELDPTRPVTLGQYELGQEAAAEATKILVGESLPPEIFCHPREFEEPFYWSVAHQTNGAAEVFGIPGEFTDALPTAVEIALVRAIAAAPPAEHSAILEGNIEVVLGPRVGLDRFIELLHIVERPLAGESLLFNSATQAVVSAESNTMLTNTCLSCFANSFRTSPLKFRFLELYRVIEARFIAEVKVKLLATFDAEPNTALQDAVDALKSEMSQIKGLAQTQQGAFEACWTELRALKDTNRFAAALFRKASRNGEAGAKWETGAALVYQTRCAIVHAGQKDIIFESFPDGDDVIDALIPHVERAALLLVGIDVN